MTKIKTTKRALFASVLSLLLCVSMLVGSTFAWFTDQASTGVNTIEAGKLDIELQMQDGDGAWVNAEESTLGFVDTNSQVLSNILWEPGCSYLLQPIKVVNKGNLWAKCKLVITAANGGEGNVDLATVIEVWEGENNLGLLRDFLNMAQAESGIKEFKLAPAGEEGAEAAFGQLKLVMKTDVGNEYQGAKLESIAITVYATQASAENDSNGNTYDDAAEYAPYEHVLTKTEKDTLDDFGVKDIEDAYVSGVIGNVTTVNNDADWRGEGEASAFENTEIRVSVTEKLPTMNIAPAVVATNNSTFENCVIKGTTYVGEVEGTTAMDLFALQNQITKLTGGEYGTVGVQGNGGMIVDGATVDHIVTAARDNTYTASKDTLYGLGGGLYVKAGSDVGKIEANATNGFVNKAANKYLKIVVEDGASVDEINLTGFDATSANFKIQIDENANVGKIILDGTEYTLAAWLAR